MAGAGATRTVTNQPWKGSSGVADPEGDPLGDHGDRSLRQWGSVFPSLNKLLSGFFFYRHDPERAPPNLTVVPRTPGVNEKLCHANQRNRPCRNEGFECYLHLRTSTTHWQTAYLRSARSLLTDSRVPLRLIKNRHICPPSVPLERSPFARLMRCFLKTGSSSTEVTLSEAE